MDQNTILKFLKGELSKQEAQKVQDWLAQDANQQLAREMLGHFWSGYSIQLKNKKPDFDRLLGKVHHNINLHRPESQEAIAPKQKFQRSIPLFYRVAAILIVPLFIASLWLFFANNRMNNQQEIAQRQVYTKPGTVTQIQLPDGSEVWLNDGTTIRYPEHFTGKERRLFVDGEAYFKVKKDPSHPFIVQNPMMNTVVTGTTFNLNAYSADHYFEATLVEGHIHLEHNKQEVDVKPGEQIRYNDSTSQMVRREVQPQIYSSWINGKLIMVDEPLNDAVKKLGRWYNVHFVLTDKKLDQYLLTATFKNEKLEQTLQNIAFALPVRYTVSEKIVDNQPQKTVFIMKK